MVREHIDQKCPVAYLGEQTWKWHMFAISAHISLTGAQSTGKVNARGTGKFSCYLGQAFLDMTTLFEWKPRSLLGS